MSRLARSSLVLAVAAASAACGLRDGEGSADEAVCRTVDREVIVDEQVAPGAPSSAFVVGADDDVWVGLIADSDFSESALLSQVTGLYVIDEAAPVEYTSDDLGGVMTDAPYLDFEQEGQFVRFDLGPGAYQLWSIKSPQVRVVRCTTNAD